MPFWEVRSAGLSPWYPWGWMEFSQQQLSWWTQQFLLCNTCPHSGAKRKFCIAHACELPFLLWMNLGETQFQNSPCDKHRLAQHDTFCLSCVKHLVMLPSSRVNLCLATVHLPPGTKHATVKHWNAQCDRSPWNWDKTRYLDQNITQIIQFILQDLQSVCAHCAQFPWKKEKKKEIEKVDLLSLFIKWEQGLPRNSILLVTFAFKPSAENDAAEYVSRFYPPIAKWHKSKRKK